MSDLIHCMQDWHLAFCGATPKMRGSWPIDLVTCQKCLAVLAARGFYKTSDPRYHDTPIDEQETEVVAPGLEDIDVDSNDPGASVENDVNADKGERI